MISVVVLTHNSESSIKKTLESVSWCDEILVLDEYSDDKTQQIARAYSAKVIQSENSNDFARARNRGLKEAKGEWVLFVDSDEVVPDALAEEIQAAIQTKKYDGYYVKRYDWFLGKWLMHGETSRVRLLRLARKSAGAWSGRVHEVWNITGKTGKLYIALEHYPHSDVAQFLKKINQYSDLRAKQLRDQNVRVSLLQILLYPSAKFFLNFILRFGFFDGVQGFINAGMMSFHSFLVRGKLWELWKD
jgi:glycosyltransferase involved in cell wall biosynthesis